jgi:probable HAF family extracellular repeat protein
MRPRFFSRRDLLLGSLGAAAWSLAAPAALLARQDAGYTPETLGGSGRASAINGSGQIAGLAGSTAAVWNQGQLKDLGAWPGDASSQAFAINDGGVIVGASWSSGSQPHAVVWSQGQIFDLGTLAGGTESMALAVNGSNQAVGWSTAADGTYHAVRWDLEQGQIIDIGTVFDGSHAEATDINDSGTIAGWAETADGTSYAFADLAQLGADQSSYALGINAGGDVVGAVQAGDGNSHAMRWTQGQPQDLGTDGVASQASAIGDDGTVVGVSYHTGTGLAVVWNNGGLYELAAPGGAGATAAYGIDASGGTIVGEADGQPVVWRR